MLRPDAQRDRLPRHQPRGVDCGIHHIAALQPHGGLRRRGRDQPAAQEVHLRRADEAGHEEVARVVVELQRAAALRHRPVARHRLAAVEQQDAVGQRHRLDLVMGDVDGAGAAEVAVQLGDLEAGLHPQRRVQVGERLVEQEDAGLAHDRAADGHPLALAARERLGLAVEQVIELQHLGRGAHLLADHRLVHLGQPQAEGHVLVDGHVREQRVGLEHHRHAALRRCHLVHALAADLQLAAGDVLQPRDHAQQRRLAAARRPDEDAELALRDVQVHVPDDGGVVAVGLEDG